MDRDDQLTALQNEIAALKTKAEAFDAIRDMLHNVMSLSPIQIHPSGAIVQSVLTIVDKYDTEDSA